MEVNPYVSGWARQARQLLAATAVPPDLINSLEKSVAPVTAARAATENAEMDIYVWGSGIVHNGNQVLVVIPRICETAVNELADAQVAHG